MNIRESSKLFAKQAKRDNRQSEKFSLMYPSYMSWKDEQFSKVKGELISLIGRF